MSDQILSECKSLPASELYPIVVPDQDPEYSHRLQLTSGRSAWGSHAWFDIPESYTSRQLAKESAARIIALPGIAPQVESNDGLRGGDYLAGIWEVYCSGSFMAVRV
jgi:hypothetical protein